MDHGESELGPVEGSGSDYGLEILDPELPLDVLEDGARGGPRQGEKGRRLPERPAVLAARPSYVQIGRPEIMPPFGNAVCLIHHNEGDGRVFGQRPEGIPEFLGLEPLRSDKGKYILPFPKKRKSSRPVFGALELACNGYAAVYPGS